MSEYQALDEHVAHLPPTGCVHCGYRVQVEAIAILRETSEAHNIPLAVMMGRGRRPPVVHARDCAIKRLSEEVGLGPSDIGHIFRRDHYTIIHALQKRATA